LEHQLGFMNPVQGRIRKDGVKFVTKRKFPGI
jgi:hypothetical protein